LFKKRTCPVPGCPKFLTTQKWADFHFRVRGRECAKHLKIHELANPPVHDKPVTEEQAPVNPVFKIFVKTFS
jgi:hypothetical protein